MQGYPWLAAGLLALQCGAGWAQAAPAEDTVTLGTPVAAESLSLLRGGSTDTTNDTRITGSTASNTARDVQTGSNSISSGSFADMAGIPVVIQNTGANVLIQNSVILNVLAR